MVSALLRAVPNPFNPRASIHYSLAERQPVAIEVFDVAGRRVRTLIDAVQDRGPHVVVWEGDDDRGVALPQGVYWAAMKTPGYESSRKLIRLH
ncbi:MAG: FlgD immunoglobulin-like domain containing protein [Candidatus Eisenbacteria bacterium]